MQSENFDKKIKDSLSQRPPENDEPVWDKMEALLDKHLPREKKDRRRIIFFLLSFLLLGGGAFIIWQINKGNKNEIAEVKSSKSNTATKEKYAPTETNNDKGISIAVIPNATDNSNKERLTKLPIHNLSSPLPGREIEIKVTKTKTNKTINKETAPRDGSVRRIPASLRNQEKERKTIDELVKNTESEKSVIENFTQKDKESVKIENQELKESQYPVSENKAAHQKKETKETNPVAAQKTKNDKKKKSFVNNLFFSVSAGPDLSIVKFDYVGKVKPVYGAGIGYNISKHFSIQTGFYTTRKMYTADPDDYYIPSRYMAYYPKLKPIKADCKVYEVPLTIGYHFNGNKKQNWFVSAGVSSLFMKKEKYNYYYKSIYTWRDTTSTRIIENKNKHYFSILNISGGYERKINQHLSFQIEPYMKITTTGVGSGKVKLNSSGVLFTAIIKPFARKP